MQAQGKFQHYSALFDDKRIAKDSLFLKLQKKLTKLLESLKLEDKDIILAIS
jgi:hypothetical protein